MSLNFTPAFLVRFRDLEPMLDENGEKTYEKKFYTGCPIISVATVEELSI